MERRATGAAPFYTPSTAPASRAPSRTHHRQRHGSDVPFHALPVLGRAATAHAAAMQPFSKMQPMRMAFDPNQRTSIIISSSSSST